MKQQRVASLRREHLKSARLRLGWSALDLGERAGIRENKVYAVERGRYLPTRDEADRWADVLRMSRTRAFPEIFNRPAFGYEMPENNRLTTSPTSDNFPPEN